MPLAAVRIARDTSVLRGLGDLHFAHHLLNVDNLRSEQGVKRSSIRSVRTNLLAGFGIVLEELFLRHLAALIRVLRDARHAVSFVFAS